ncbi:hypothetical protein Tco_0737748 [Tanacetum coccineum]
MSKCSYMVIFEERYVCQPPGFEDPDHPDKCTKVVKALYGTSSSTQSLIYVDDIIFGSTKKELCEEFEKLMKDNQDKYVHEILKKFNYTDVKSASTPTDLERPLVKDADADDVDEHLYRYMIRSLMYLTASRPRSSLQFVHVQGFPGFSIGVVNFLAMQETNCGCHFYTRTEYVAAAIAMDKHQELTSPEQTATGKDFSNPLIVDSLLKTIWSSMHHVCRMKHWLVQSKRLLGFSNEAMASPKQTGYWTAEILTDDNGTVKIHATIDGHSLSITEGSLRRHLKLDDQDGITSL